MWILVLSDLAASLFTLSLSCTLAHDSSVPCLFDVSCEAAHDRHQIAKFQLNWTALMHAAEMNRIHCVRLLLDGGAGTETQSVVRVVVYFVVCISSSIRVGFIFQYAWRF